MGAGTRARQTYAMDVARRLRSAAAAARAQPDDTPKPPMAAVAALVPGAGPPAPRGNWTALFVLARSVGIGVALLLLVVHRVTAHDDVLIVLTASYGAISILAVLWHPRLHRDPIALAIDCAAALAFVAASEDWRSPFYVLMLSALILPGTGLRRGLAGAYGAGISIGYAIIAFIAGLDAPTLASTIRLETLTTHVMVPPLVTLALMHAAGLVRRLDAERVRSERIAIEGERRRIALELHDSAKQRVHAAHLVVSALQRHASADQQAALDQAALELRSAADDMDASLTDLRQPLEDRPLDALLNERARELRAGTDAEIEVTGVPPDVSPLVALHVYRIAAEALTNAVRHSGARRITVAVGSANGHLRLTVADDGGGFIAPPRPGALGLRSMHSRASSLGGSMNIEPGPQGRGTVVTVDIPLEDQGATR